MNLDCLSETMGIQCIRGRVRHTYQLPTPPQSQLRKRLFDIAFSQDTVLHCSASWKPRWRELQRPSGKYHLAGEKAYVLPITSIERI